jgi:hypothetical protein
MTDTDDSQGSTRPISVAELLAKNGTIGAPPAGGRRRRRRGGDSVTVAELTGEIPIIRPHDDYTDDTVDDHPDDHDATAAETTRTLPVVTDEPAASNGAPTVYPETDDDTDHVDESPALDVDEEDADDDYSDAVADYTAHIESRDTDDALNFFTPARRSSFAPRRFKTDAERMSPDPVDEIPLDTDDADVDDDSDIDDVDDLDVQDALGDAKDRDDLPSYLRSSSGGLFGGPSGGSGVADDFTRRDSAPTPEDIDLDDDAEAEPATSMSSFARGAWVVGQCVLAVAFGAGLFIAFDQLWKWNNIVALVLSVLVILGLVVGVRVVRKTEDIGSTLIAVAVGALVTLGPLALLQSG